jgi:hypothetical protein
MSKLKKMEKKNREDSFSSDVAILLHVPKTPYSFVKINGVLFYSSQFHVMMRQKKKFCHDLNKNIFEK